MKIYTKQALDICDKLNIRSLYGFLNLLKEEG